ncbi:MAG: GTPase ObgE [Deltaproteobacteria bacterium]|nr:GTPase ObgE [Deltaproteobacteria bacterium]
MSAFIDEVTLYAKAGDGGNGAVAWRREAHVPRGGPAGGDGGDGGDVVLIGDDGVHSLLDFKYMPRLIAKNGEQGRGKKQAGHQSADVVAHLPLGTQVFDADTGELLGDLTAHEQRLVICKGGSGGFGNSRFATPSRQAPEFAKPGLPGEERTLRLSLKLMADVGLLGFPNAGKSTFVARVSAARPKIADYPFTTLVPQLGVVKVPHLEHTTFVIADIPGLVEGAHEGKGLGVRFLKHLERVRVLLHLIEVPIELVEGGTVPVEHTPNELRGPIDLVERYKVLRKELAGFSDDLAARPEVVALNKTDLLVVDPLTLPAVKKLQTHLKKKGIPLLLLSGATGQHLDEVLLHLWQRVQQEKAPKPVSSTFDPSRDIR